MDDAVSPDLGAPGTGVPAAPPEAGGGFAAPGPGGPAVPPRELARMLDQVPIGIVSLDCPQSRPAAQPAREGGARGAGA